MPKGKLSENENDSFNTRALPQKKTTMKKIVTTLLGFSAVAAFGTVLTGAMLHDCPSEDGSSCCQAKTETVIAALGSEKAACCSESGSKSPSCSGGACAVEPCKDGACKDGTKCGGVCDETTEKPTEQVSVDTDQDCGGACGDCKGDCSTCASLKAKPVEETATKKCEHCEVECATCAEAREKATKEEADADESTAPAAAGQGRRMGHGGDSQHDIDHQVFFYLIEHRDAIRRTVKNIDNGVETVTESDKEDIANKIKEHVAAMYNRMENDSPIRMRDPLFREVFANADKIKLVVEKTEHGVRVRETSDDPYAVKLIQEHAKVVSLWLKNGYAELPKNHAAPAK